VELERKSWWSYRRKFLGTCFVESHYPVVIILASSQIVMFEIITYTINSLVFLFSISVLGLDGYSVSENGITIEIADVIP
jgi:hypothetical protein